MRGLFGQSSLPSGLTLETATVARSTPVSFSVARECVTEFEPGAMKHLLQDGRLVPAAVVGRLYNTGDGKTYVTVNVTVTTGLLAVYHDAMSPHCGGNDTNVLALWQGESNGPGAILYDTSLQYAHHSSGLTLYGNAPVLTASNRKFGGSCIQTNNGGYWMNWSDAVPGTTYSVDFHVYGQVSGVFWGGTYNNTNPATYAGYFGFNGSFKPYIYGYNTYTSPVSATVTGTVGLNANQWNHVMFGRDGSGYWRCAINGQPSFATNATPIGTQLVSSWGGGIFGMLTYTEPSTRSMSQYINGLFDSIRVYNNVWLWGTGAFTPPAKPYGPDAR